MRIDHKLHIAMNPKSIASTDVLFNGAAAASAVGIPVGDAKEVFVNVHLGAVSASQTGVAVGLYTSSNTSNVSNAAQIRAVADAVLALTKANAENKINQIAVKVADIVPVTGQEAAPQYLYVKYAQETADAVLAECVVDTNDQITLPVDPVA